MLLGLGKVFAVVKLLKSSWWNSTSPLPFHPLPFLPLPLFLFPLLPFPLPVPPLSSQK